MDGSIPSPERLVRAQRLMGEICSALGLKIELSGDTASVNESLIVCNHISWIDIPVISSVIPCVFLSKAEIARWPAIGWLARSNGTLFIQRGKQGAADEARKNIVTTIRSGVNVLVFPEGTTSTGEDVQRFHPRLYAAALEAECNVTTLSLCYLDSNGKRCRVAPYIDDQTFFGNLWEVMAQVETRVKIEIASVVNAADFEQRRALSDYTRSAMRQSLHKQVSAE